MRKTNRPPYNRSIGVFTDTTPMLEKGEGNNPLGDRVGGINLKQPSTLCSALKGGAHRHKKNADRVRTWGTGKLLTTELRRGKTVEKRGGFD